MKRSSSQTHSQKYAQLLGRLGCLAVTLGAAFGCVGAAWAQTGPLPTSPPQPTPYQSPLFHSGGASTPATLNATLPFLNPLYGQLQGTPTEVYPQTAAGVPTEIPSFLLGDYDPTQPPAGVGIYYPQHFADGDVYSWNAPFDYVPAGAGTVTVDDSLIASATFTASSNFVQEPPLPVGTVSPSAGTAAGGEYLRLPPSATGTATWTLTATVPGDYSVYFHIPDNIADSTGAVETRSTAVNYTVTVSGAFAQTVTATVSQTEANSSQFLAGPFQLAAGDTITVTLQRDATHNQANVLDYLIADSMTMQATIGDVQSTPTAVNYDYDPTDFVNAKYWGIYTPATGGVQVSVGATAAQNAIPDTTGGLTPNTTPIYKYGSTALASDGPHRIRQTVYFGRSEPTLASQTSVDDSNAAFTSVIGGGTVSDTTATNGTYLVYSAVSGAGTPAATWTLTAPANGTYFVTAHIPANVKNPPARTANPDDRIPDASYTIAYGSPSVGKTVFISQLTGGSVTLPTGGIPLLKNQTLTVTLNTGTQSAIASPQVVADSLTMTTGSTKGAIYCADGFTGGILWRFETPPSLNGASAPVFSAPAVAQIHVMTSPGNLITSTAPTYATKLVVIVGDNNGLVYCLDAIGNGDGTSNANVLDAGGQPITIPQPVYGATPPIQVDAAGYTPHVGTTRVYWIYRPDPNLPKYAAGANLGKLKLATAHDPNSDLPVPAAFGPASPTIYVNPAVSAANLSNAAVFVGNSNGVLYALDALGVPYSATNDPASITYPYGDNFNVSQDLRSNTTDPVPPTCQPLWWFTLRGANPNVSTNASSASIASAPAVYVNPTSLTFAGTTYTSYPVVYIGSAHEEETTSNIGRLYAINGLTGPSGNSGKSSPLTQPNPALAAYTGPGSPNYNIAQRPQISLTDTSDWSFPDAVGTDTYSAGKSSSGKPRPALGNVTGSPVVFTNVNEGTVTHKTRIYFAANVGIEIPAGSAAGTVASPRPDDTQTGRIWAVNLDGSVGTTTNTNAHIWAYPLANDPNDATKDTVAEPFAPIGAFLHMTPALGFVQFPATITNGDSSPYAHTDAVQADIKGQSVPMLYFGTRGVNDTSLYAVDIDGDMNPLPVASPVDGRTIYHLPSPDGAIFQSSPILITNATSTGGNGGSLLIVGGDTLYDFSATPVSNPNGGQAFPLIREDRAFVGFGPLSSPAVAAANVQDLFTPPSAAPAVTDWVYCGDSSTGLCRAITPRDSTDAGIPTELGNIVPPDVNPPVIQDLSSIIQTYLVGDANANSADARTVANGGAALPVGVQSDGSYAPLPVYEWSQNVYIRFTNIAPPNPGENVTLYVHDGTLTAANFNAASLANPITFYSNPASPAIGDIHFTLSDTTEGATVDSGQVPVSPFPITALPADGFVVRTDPAPPVASINATNNLVDSSGKRWIGAYTYAISDGTARRNTPGGRRRVQDVNQTVAVRLFTNKNGNGDITDPGNFALPTTTATTAVLRGTATNGNEVSVLDPITGKYKLKAVAPVDQPTFGILNPLGVRGGGIPLALQGGSPSNAVQIGDELGPFRGVSPTVPVKSPSTGTVSGGDVTALEALANGNSTYQGYAPPSSSGVGVNPTTLPDSSSAFNPPVATQVVVTATGLIPHNSSGDNLDATALPAPQGTFSNANPDGLGSANFGSPDQPYALDIFDRSPLGLVGKNLKVKMGVTGGQESLAWNDNHAGDSAYAPNNAVVNILPWETPPTSYKIGANTSPDYPGIPSQYLTVTLHANDNAGGSTAGLSSDSAVATPAQAGSDLQHRIVTASPVQVHIDVPHYQPANQQLYLNTTGNAYTSGAEVAPIDLLSNLGTRNAFPMGYVTTKRIYVPNQYGRYDASTAYRDIRIYTGVPISMATSMADGTIDVGKGPSGYGIQTEDYVALNVFTPYTAAFQTNNNFLRLTIHNDGNVNLLNVHLDQKQYFAGAPVYAPPINHLLTLSSDTLEPLSVIPGYDSVGFTGVLNAGGGRVDAAGAAVTLPGTSVPEFPFLVRSSLDTDLVTAYGRNPGLTTTYPGATFHKALPGSATPTTLRVPDAPDNAADPAFSVPATTSPAGLPQVGHQALPFIGVALPFGTPVGAYHQTVRLFEGMDTNNYSTYNTSGPLAGLYNPYYPPQYGKAVGGQGTPDLSATNNYPTDVFQYGFQPMSDPGVTLRTTALEDRMTDNATFGALPQIDNYVAPGTAHTSTPDFAPAAFREWSTTNHSGNMSLYWTSGRDYTAGTTLPYDIYGMNVNFTNPAFLAGARAGVNGQAWWTPIGATAPYQLFPDALASATHSGLTVALDQPVLSGGSFIGSGDVYAFDVAVTSTPYQNTLYSYPVTGATGALGAGQVISDDPSQVKYGVHGLYVKSASPFTRALWAFWTGSTRGRTAIYYNSQDAAGVWLPATGPSTVGLLPVPAGLTSVADPSPLLLTAPTVAIGGALGGKTQPVIEVTFSGTAPDGSTDLYGCRYAPDSGNPALLDLVSFPTMTEKLTAVNGWYQARDMVWSRTGAFNISVGGVPIVYSGTTPLFTKAIFDKASGLLVLTGVSFSGAAGGPVTVYVDETTGRVRFTQPPPATAVVTATFNPLARRLTNDTRSNVGPATFLDPTFKDNDTPGLGRAQTDRRWYVWRKSGISGDAHSATLYEKTQRLTVFLPTPISSGLSITVGNGASTALVDVDATRGRLYFPITDDGTPTGKPLEGETVSVAYNYVPPSTITPSNPTGTPQAETPPPDTIQWQDEQLANGTVAASPTASSPTDSVSGLATVLDYAVPIDTIVNENNVAAFLDTDAYLDLAGGSGATDAPHKVWLFWNSTRNGTSDLYYETINPRFSVGP